MVSEKIQAELAAEVVQRTATGKRAPHLAAILVGDDPASQVYVGSKVKTCEKIGYKSTLHRLAATSSAAELEALVNNLAADEGVDGILLQMPLPKHLEEEYFLELIPASKDVDGFHPTNMGRMSKGLPCFIPATPYGILLLLEHYKIPTEGKHCVVVGRSNIVGTPMAILMSRNTYPGNCTTTIVHSKTKNMNSICAEADILIAAIGKPEFIKAGMVKEGAVVIDVGINRVPDATKKSGARLAGDVDFTNVAPKCSYITPVPGGVGPMTIAALMKNTLRAANR